jgi:2-polyprenyl-3-methyl-5-hydroxy-6-metoxy-1,4-benzoquinol methylase
MTQSFEARLSEDALAAFVARIDRDALRDRIAHAQDPQGVLGLAHFDIIAGEARATCAWLREEGADLSGRVLEVGAGGGLFTAFLRAQGVNVEAIEPIGEGFDPMHMMRAALNALLGESNAAWPIRASDLDPAKHGRFDLIFSINVLEHMRPLSPNLDGMARVLAPGGAMLHLCPNYRVPYEPHFGLPLAPGVPALTPWLLRPSLRRDPLWRSLNFITAADLRRFARRNSLRVEFSPGQFAKIVQRLRQDEAFAERHTGLASHALRVLSACGLLGLIGRLPSEWSTPMSARLRAL